MISQLIPSMFIRRLLLLGGMLAAAVVVPAIQLFRWTVTDGSALRKEAEKRMVDERLIPTHRGKIVDRNGQVLAYDRASYDIAVDYQVITGRWAFTEAAKKARRENRSRWPSLSPEQREALILECLPEQQQRLEAMWSQFAFVAGIPRDDLEKKKNEVLLRVQTLASSIWGRQDAQREEMIAKGRELGSEGLEEATEAAAPRKPRTPIREQVIPHVLLHDIDDQTAFAFQRLLRDAPTAATGELASMPGLRVIDSTTREYPKETIEVLIQRSTLPGPLRDAQPLTVKVEGVATHLIGWMRDTYQAMDAVARKQRTEAAGGAGGAGGGRADLGRYLPGDAAGAFGIESAREFELRGSRGLETTHLDTGERSLTPAVEGEDQRLTIDILLQARLQALFDPALGLAVVQPWQGSMLTGKEGQRLNGSIVVIDIDSGDILAMVTSPTFTRRSLRENIAAMLKDEQNTPLVNRAFQKPYMPGSIVKPVMLCAATTNGNYRPDQRIACTGHLLPNDNTKFRCWIYKQFHTTHSDKFGHDLDGADAIMASCNIFFFELGRRMGPKDVVDWYTRFGVGPDAVHPDLGLFSRTEDGREIPLLYPGTLSRAAANAPSISEAILMGIGQGPISWTPLHAADAYATIGRGGLRITPHLLADSSHRRTIDLRLDQRAIAMALDGLRRSVEDENGTTHHLTIEQGREPIFNVPGVTVRAKSGTATAKIVKQDLNDDGTLDNIYFDHAWCVLLVGPGNDRPRYAVSVVADEAGSGGKAAGPLANQAVWALVEQGYLPKSAASSRGHADASRAGR